MSYSTDQDATYLKLVTRLLEGDVICPWSQPALARLLENPDIQHRINRWVQDLEMKLSETRSGTGMYLTYEGWNPQVKSAAKENFSKLIKDLRFYTQALELLMSSLHPDASFVPGEEIRFNNLLSQIDQSTTLQSQLAGLPSSKKHEALRDQLESLFSRLKKEGLLVEANTLHSIYQITARMDLIQEMLEFIAENEALPNLEPDHEKSQSVLL
jgi:hypothetical protein